MSTTVISREEAKAAGLKRYFTGEPCRHGHLCERYLWGACVECYRLHDSKPNRKDYHRSTDRAWRKSNPEKVAAKNIRAYQKARPDRLAAAAAYRADNSDQVRECNRRWRSENAESVAERKAVYYAANKTEFFMRNRLRSARVRAAEGRFTKEDVAQRLKAQGGRCAYCKTCIKHAFEIDHVQPITKGGSNWPHNIQLTCPSCNSRKGNKEPERFARELGLLI